MSYTESRHAQYLFRITSGTIQNHKYILLSLFSFLFCKFLSVSLKIKKKQKSSK
ncbi:hypothetical protein BDV40DRAFT_211428 [Aspergillus tamarii]|uniref:Uncharacterized protein n=1 Tax=Aspergillus tamarii TaxID=41984 RepID=A0A5N6UPP2_ASPTM|nr:hypothetical protein BDV40DRAFT_211428 [Aspergillus tamarii]